MQRSSSSTRFFHKRQGGTRARVRFVHIWLTSLFGLFLFQHGETPIATRQPDHRSCCHYEMVLGSGVAFRCLLAPLDN